MHDEEEPLVCRSPGCRRRSEGEDAAAVEDDGADSISETDLLLLVVLLVLLPCCVCYMQCGLVSCLAGYRTWCPHCKEPLEKCHAGRITVTLSSVPFGKGTDSDAMAEFREQFRRDVCSALVLTRNQVSVHEADARKGEHCFTIHLAAARAASTLERQIKEFDSDHLADFLPETRLLFKPHHDKHKEPHSLPRPMTNADVSAEDLVAIFCRQSSDPLSRLRRGKYTQFIVNVQPATTSTCTECDKNGNFCSCHCPCCGHLKGGCPALCQRYCDHCAAPTQICNSGDVGVIFDLNREALPGGDQEMFLHALRMEIADALAIHPVQASISSLRFGPIRVDAHFISCNDAAWALGHPGFCILLDHERHSGSIAEASDSQKDANLAPAFHTGSFGGVGTPARSNGSDFDARKCKCLTRAQLVALFIQQCEDKDSRLRQGKFFSATASATKWDHEHARHMLCRICNQTKSCCKCKCQGCHRRLDACRVDCLMPLHQQPRLPAVRPSSIDAPAGASTEQPQLSLVDMIQNRREDISLSVIPTPVSVQTSQAPNLFPSTLDVGEDQQAGNGFSERVVNIVGNDGPKMVPTRASALNASSSMHSKVHTGLILGSSATQVSTADVVTIKRSDIATATTTTLWQPWLTSEHPKVDVIYDSDWTLAPQRLTPPRRPQTPPRYPSPAPPPRSSKSTPPKPCSPPNPPSVTDSRTGSRATAVGQLVINSAPVELEPPSPYPVEVGKDAWASPSPEVMGQRVDFQTSAQAWTHTNSFAFASSVFVQEEHGKHDKRTVTTESSRSVWNSSPSAISVSLPTPRKVVATSETTGFVGLKSEATAGFVGLVVSKELPHAVAKVDDLVDINSVPQGQPGYSNAEVRVGDLILEIDGQDVRNMPLAQLHQLLSGTLYSVVQITLQQRQSGVVYTVRVLRHRFHEFDSAAAKPRLPKFAKDSRRKLGLAASVQAKGPVSRNFDACYAGLEVTEQPPHAVVAIDDLVDPHFVKQGDPRYSNPTVHVGDRILAVGGLPAEHVPVRELHGISLLRTTI